MERRALGKGIGALIPEQPTETSQRIVYLPVERIKPNPFQPRENFDAQGLEDLTQSIKEKGIIQPVLVRRKGEDYELIAGERRLRAAHSLNIKEIPVIIKEAEDIDSLELSLIENIQRQNLNSIEEARAYQYLIEKFHLTQEEVSDILGKARVTVTNTLRLLKLPLEIQEEIKKERISFAHGRALLEITDPNQQRRLLNEIISKALSVRELENMIKSRRGRSLKIKTAAAGREPALVILQERLQQVLATKVRINKRKKCGTIVIEFYSGEDLQRIANAIKGEAHV